MEQTLLDRLKLDDVLVKFKLHGRYHVVSSVILNIGMMFNAVWSFNYVFVTEDVKYSCADSRLESNKEIENRTMAWCSNPALCSEWVYDKPESFVAEFQLACQDWKRTLVGSMHMFGNMAGVLIVGTLSDRYGRKVLVIITVVAAGVLGLGKSCATSYWFYVALEFMEGAIGDFHSPLYFLAIEMVATKSRVTYALICNIGFGLGGILLLVMAWLISYWRILLRVMYAPGLLSIFLIYLLDESPRWLLATGKKKAAVKIIRNAAKLNKIEVQENLDMISYEKVERPNINTAIVDTLKSRTLMKRFFVCIIWWSTCNFVNNGLLLNSVLLAGNKYVNFALSLGMKIPSNLLATYIINKFNRKGPMIFFFIACGILCTGQPFIPNNFLWLLISTYMLCKFTSCMCVCVMYIFTSELFPTQTRNSMAALCSAVANIGGMIAPQTPLLAVVWAGLPTVVFGAVSLIAGLVTLLVPDTADRTLPDTVCQAEAMEKLALKEGCANNAESRSV